MRPPGAPAAARLRLPALLAPAFLALALSALAPAPAPALSALGWGIEADGSRSARSDDGRFWSQISAAPHAFADFGSFELSLALGIGRIAREARWCFLIATANLGLLWQPPISALGISPLVGFGLGAVPWARRDCLRSDYTLDAIQGSPFRDFSALRLKAGFGRDFGIGLCGELFFRARLVGYYGKRRSGSPNPLGGALRLGVGRRVATAGG